MTFSNAPSPAASAEIASLDPVSDCERIAFLLTYQLFPLTIEKALEYALFKTYAVPSISRILAATGEFSQRAQKRYDDTVLLLAEVGENGRGHPRADAALARINHMHGRFRIRNDDFLYTLSTFVFEPIRALDLYGPRPMTQGERLGWFHAYRRLGEGMGIPDLPGDAESFREWRRGYEAREIAYAPSNRTVADATMKVLFDMLGVPSFARRASRAAVIALMEPHIAAAFGYPAPRRSTVALVEGAMRARRLAASLLPEGRGLRLQTGRRLPTYPGGYAIAALGTFAPAADPGQ